MRMKSGYLAVFIIIILLLAATPWVDGLLFKQNFFNTLAILNKEAKLKLKVVEYHTGWFSSTAKLQVESVDPNQFQDMPPVQMQLFEALIKGLSFEDLISHGPFIKDPETNHWTLGLASFQNTLHIGMLERFLNTPPDQGTIMTHTLVSFGGDYLTYVKSLTVSTQIAGVGKISWSGLKGKVNTNFSSDHLNSIRSNFILGSLAVESPNNFSLKTSDYTMNSDITRLSNGLWQGQQAFTAPSFALSLPDSNQVLINGVNISTQFGMSPHDMYNVMLDYNIQNLVVPNFNINPIKIKFAFNELDPHILLQIANLPPQAAEQRLSLVPRLVTANTAITGNSLIQTNAGRFMADLDAHWQPNMLPTSLDALYNNANAKLNARISIALVNQVLDVIDAEFKKKQAAAAAAATKAPTAQPFLHQKPKGTSKEMLDALVQQGKLSQLVETQLIELQNADLSTEIYTTTIDNMVLRKEITADIASTLKQNYINPPKPEDTAPKTTPKVAEELPSVSAKQQIQEQLKQGYLIQDKDDYVLAATMEQGVVKLNGKVFPPQPAPETQPQAPAAPAASVPSVPAAPTGVSP